MKIGIIGAGAIGTGLGRRLADSGHQILVSQSRTPERLAAAAARISRDCLTGSPSEAALHGDVVIIATPWPMTLDLLAPIAQDLREKTVWDTTNPFAPDMSELTVGTTTSAGEEIAKRLQGAFVVKAIAPFAELLHSASTEISGRKPDVFVCGDDAVARGVVARLVSEVGAEPVESGPLKMARFTEPAGMLITNLAYVQGLGSRMAIVLIR